MGLVKDVDKDTHFKLDEAFTLADLADRASQEGGVGPSGVGGFKFIDFQMERAQKLRILYKPQYSGSNKYVEARRIIL